jgi:hypothetical protein
MERIIKIRGEINEKETKQTIQKVIETKSGSSAWFLMYFLCGPLQKKCWL